MDFKKIKDDYYSEKFMETSEKMQSGVSYFDISLADNMSQFFF
jgi:hypothetical protein